MNRGGKQALALARCAGNSTRTRHLHRRWKVEAYRTKDCVLLHNFYSFAAQHVFSFGIRFAMCNADFHETANTQSSVQVRPSSTQSAHLQDRACKRTNKCSDVP